MHRLHIKAEPEQIYRAITTAEGIRNWWTRDADLKSTVGGNGEFRFYGGTMITRVRIDELEPVKRVRWSVIESFAPGWNGTTMEFDLTPGGEESIFRFAQRGFIVADDRFAMSTTGWAMYFFSLQQYIETGRGTPAPDIDYVNSRYRFHRMHDGGPHVTCESENCSVTV